MNLIAPSLALPLGMFRDLPRPQHVPNIHLGQMAFQKADGLKFPRQRGIEIQNNFPERPNSENPVGPFGVLEMVSYGKYEDFSGIPLLV